MTTILVTGAAGFIGSHVADALIARGDDVFGLDNLNDYYSPHRKRSNIAETQAGVRGPNRFTLVEGDVRDRTLVKELFEGARIDAVVHLAAMAGVRASIASPQLYAEVNLTGTLNLLEAAARHGVRNFVFASSSSVYGDTDRVPFQETDRCDRPLSPYAATKRAAEVAAYAHHHLYGVPVTALRYFTVYGPRGRPDMMAYKVFDSIYSGREVPLFDGGQMHRDWTYIGDIVAGTVAALDNPHGYEIVNLGRGEPVLLADFVRAAEELAGKRANLVSAPMDGADVRYTGADIRKARTLLGYDPRVSVGEGLERFWCWYQRAVAAEG